MLNTIVFIPFMYYRAKQEEKELTKTFKEYKDYQKRVGMFLPKLIKKRVKKYD
jgi:protein-S-isoprenylcysteine O-methyltransferase Ste14